MPAHLEGTTGTPARILIVEDEERLARGIRRKLEDDGYRAAVAVDGRTALERIRREKWDLVLMDVMLPELDGFSVCRSVRGDGIDVPILFLTARGDPEDRIRGLEAGGDDYLSKPFHLRELMLRVAAILRRSSRRARTPSGEESFRFGGNEFDFSESRGRSWDGAEQKLNRREAAVLMLLAERPGKVVTREEILDRVWGYDVLPSTRAIETLIMRLRRRFERDPENPRHFHTVRGVGYRFTREAENRS